MAWQYAVGSDGTPVGGSSCDATGPEAEGARRGPTAATDGDGDRGGFFLRREGPESGPAIAYLPPKVLRGRV